MRSSLVFISVIVLLITGCASNIISPSYATSNPNMQVGGERPVDFAPTVENAGSFCLEVTETWHNDGKTPDGQALWAKNTMRRVVPCAK
jgi:hypothetical protein